jgi:hypothetical protein
MIDPVQADNSFPSAIELFKRFSRYDHNSANRSRTYSTDDRPESASAVVT